MLNLLAVDQTGNTSMIEEMSASLDDAVIIIDREKKITALKGKAQELLNISEAEVIGMTVPECFAEAGQISDMNFAQIDVSINERKSTGMGKESCFKRNDGKTFYFTAVCTSMINGDKLLIGAFIVIRDVTIMHKLNDRLADESHSLNMVFNTATVGMVVLNEQAMITAINDTALQLMETTREEALNKRFGDAFCCVGSLEHGCNNGRKCKSCSVKFAVENALQTEESTISAEVKMVYKKRDIEQYIWLKVSVSPTRMGGEKNIVITMNNITSRKEREIEIARSRDFHLQILSAFPGMVWWHKQNKLVYLNEPGRAFIGRNVGNMSRTDWAELVHPDDRHRYLKNIHNSSYTDELRIKNSEGKYRWIWCVQQAMYDFEGHNDGIVSIGLDITHRKEIELAVEHSRFQFHSLFMNMQSGFCYNKIVVDERGRATDFEFMQCNEEYKRIHYFTGRNIIGKRFSEVTATFQNYHDYIERCGELALNGTGKFNCQLQIVSTGQWIDAAVYSIEKGYFAVIHRDISKQKEYETKLHEAMLEAKSASQAKSQFLANMSHEIRTPMNGMIGMIDLTLLTQLGDEQRENLQIAKSCANSLLVIINDILDFSKLEAGKMSLEMISYDLKEAIYSVIKTHSLKAEDKGIEFLYTFSMNVPQCVIGDPTRLKQILHNLIGNAVKFTDKGSVEIVVKKVKEESTEKLKFTIEDTGIGIKEDDMGKLFKGFSQVDGSITRKFGGTGLGLTITRQLIEMMHGRIWVESQFGKGSKFSFVIPLHETVNEYKPKSEIINNSSIQQSLKVLLVEDDSLNRLVLYKILEELGYEIDTRENGLEAVEASQSSKYDCILMDMQMPVMSGLEAVQEIRRIETDKDFTTPIIALTAYALKGDKERFLAGGIDGYVAKPVKINELDKEIRRVVTEAHIRNGQIISDVFKTDIDDDDDMSEIMKYCYQQVGDENKEAEKKKMVFTPEEISQIIDIGKSIEKDDLKEVEKQIDTLKANYPQVDESEIKDIILKMQLAVHSGNKDELNKEFAQLKRISCLA